MMVQSIITLEFTEEELDRLFDVHVFWGKDIMDFEGFLKQCVLDKAADLELLGKLEPTQSDETQ